MLADYALKIFRIGQYRLHHIYLGVNKLKLEKVLNLSWYRYPDQNHLLYFHLKIQLQIILLLFRY
jgi:hypothetical protein